MKKTAIWIVVLAGLVAPLTTLVPSYAVQAPTHSSWVIVPGEGWGPIRLGMDEQQVYAIMGTPEKVNNLGTWVRDVYFRDAKMTFANFDNQGKYPLIIILVESAVSGRTPEGIGVGSLLPEVLEAYGDSLHNDCIDFSIFEIGQADWLGMRYARKGIEFEFVLYPGKMWMPVEKVQVFSPDEKCMVR